jgi:hypothetical protein
MASTALGIGKVGGAMSRKLRLIVSMCSISETRRACSSFLLGFLAVPPPPRRLLLLLLLLPMELLPLLRRWCES